jgi:hypothetical protein
MKIIKKLKRIKCRLGYHKYFLVKELTPWSRKIGCKHCGTFFGMNDDAKVVLPWDSDLEQMYKTIGVINDHI